MASATALQLRRGTTAQHAAFTGAPGEVTVDTTKKSLVVHDGTTAGGSAIAKSADLAPAIASAITAALVNTALTGTPKSNGVNVATVSDIASAIAAALVNTGLTGAPTAPNPIAGTRSTRLATMQMFGDEFPGSMGSPGWKQIPGPSNSKLILQWGGGIGETYVSFPTAFPNACWLVIPTVAGVAGMATYASLGSGGFLAKTYNEAGAAMGWGMSWIALGN